MKLTKKKIFNKAMFMFLAAMLMLMPFNFGTIATDIYVPEDNEDTIEMDGEGDCCFSHGELGEIGELGIGEEMFEFEEEDIIIVTMSSGVCNWCGGVANGCYVCRPSEVCHWCGSVANGCYACRS